MLFTPIRMKTVNTLLVFVSVLAGMRSSASAQPQPDTLSYPSFVWKSAPPQDCPFTPSEEFGGIRFVGLKSGFHFGDTWYPSWAADGRLYSPWTDGKCWRLDGGYDRSISDEEVVGVAQTGHAVMEGDDPMHLKVYSLGVTTASAKPYGGRYPGGSLLYNDVWYYGTYCLSPKGQTPYGGKLYNWPWLGPFVGFRYSTDQGRTWKESPHTPEKPLFGETGVNGYPVKIGSPHFVDFGRNMEYSPDGKAYLVAHGGDTADTQWRFWNQSWITGDHVYLLRVTPTIANMNDSGKYEFYAGKDDQGLPVWTHDFRKIKPLLSWNNSMGCVTVTYNAPLKRYFMSITDGGNTVAKMHTYVLESDRIAGEWKLVTYMRDFGEQAYFVNIPSKFISEDGLTAWLMYSGNFSRSWNGVELREQPPGSHYGMVLHKIRFVNQR
jgi:hypothetical protein